MAETETYNPFDSRQPSSDGGLFNAPRAPPPKTYKRNRPAELVDDVSSAMTSSDGPGPTVRTPAASPAKALLIGFQSGSSAFLDHVRRLQPDAESEPTPDELASFIKLQKAKRAAVPARLGVQLAMPPSSSSLSSVPDSVPDTATHAVTSPLTSLPATSSQAARVSASGLPSPLPLSPPRPAESSLSLPPSSPPKVAPARIGPASSPSRLPERAQSPPASPVVPDVTISPRFSPLDDEDETFPVRKTRTVKASTRRAHITTSDEEDSTPRPPSPSSPTPSPRKSVRAKGKFPGFPSAHSRSASPASDAVSPTGKPGTAIPPPRRSHITFSDDEDEPRRSSPSPTPRRPAPTKSIGRRPPTPRSRSASPASDAGSSTRQVAALARSEDEEEPAPHAKSDAFFEALYDEDQADMAKERARSTESAESIKDGGSMSPVKRPKQIKAPSKKETELTKREMEAAQRSRNASFKHIAAVPLNPWDWLQAAANVVKGKPRADPPSRPRASLKSSFSREKTPEQVEEITTFPSSRDTQGPESTAVDRQPLIPVVKHALQFAGSARLDARETRDEEPMEVDAPDATLVAAKRYMLEASDDEEPEVEKSNADVIREMELEREAAKEEGRRKNEAEAEAKRKAEVKARRQAETARRKADALAQQKARVPAQKDSDEEDDFIIQPFKPQATAQAVKRHAGPDAKAVNNRDPKSVPANTKNRMRILSMAGKSHRSKADDASDTYVDYAAKFGHQNLRSQNAGSKPAGKKAGRDRPLGQNELDAMLARKHTAQAQTVRAKKEQDYGRTKTLPGKVEVNYEELAEANRKRAELQDVEDEDEDPEDGDFALSGEEDDEAGSGDEGAEAPEGDDAMEVDEPVTATSPVPAEVDEETFSPVKIRKPRRHPARVAFASDDEEEPYKMAIPASDPVVVPVGELGPSQIAAHGFGVELDLAGFGGDDDFGGGFSQLFDPTQLNTPSGSGDGFAVLRQEPAPLLQAHAILPKNHVTATQAERDEELLAREMEEAMMPVERPRTQPAKRYLNDAGFFTQTKPSSQFPTQARLQLAGSSSMSILSGLGLDPSDAEDEAGSEAPDAADESGIDEPLPNPSSPLRRLRRRASDDVPDESFTLEPTQRSTPPAPKENAFTRLMETRRQSPRPKSKPVKSMLVEEQAEESDEDDGWGGKLAGGPEEDEGENENGYVEGLVDDQAVDEETRRKQDALAEEKRREVEKADDAKREAAARGVTEGKHRTRRRHGKDFISDDEADEEGGRRHLSKKARRARRMELREDGVAVLPGEQNAFVRGYVEGLDSEPDDELDEKDETPAYRSPEPARSYKEKKEMLQRAGGARRRAEQSDEEEDELDVSAKSGSRKFYSFDDDVIDVDKPESAFTISRPIRKTASTVLDEDSQYGPSANRRSQAEAALIFAAESATERRGVGIGQKMSVVNHAIPASKLSKGDQKYGARKSGGGPRAGGPNTAKLLGSKTASFAK